MTEQRLRDAAVEVWNFDTLRTEKFMHYAYVAKLLLPERYREWRRKWADRRCSKTELREQLLAWADENLAERTSLGIQASSDDTREQIAQLLRERHADVEIVSDVSLTLHVELENDGYIFFADDHDPIDRQGVSSAWWLEGLSPGEGSYILQELRAQLGEAISELHAFRDVIEEETFVMDAVRYALDVQSPPMWTERSDEPVRGPSVSQTHVFPRSLDGYLVVPAPPESAEE